MDLVGAAIFSFNNVSAAAASWAVADIAMAGREPWRRSLTALALFPIVILGILLCAGSVGVLSAGPVTLIAGTVAAVCMATRWTLHKQRTDLPTGALRAPQQKDGVLTIACVSLAVVGASWLINSVFLATTFVVDDLSYHATAVVHWLHDRSLSMSLLNYHAYYPFNAELISLWFTLPFGSAGFASLSGLYWGALLAAACVALSMVRNVGPAPGAIAAALALTSPILQAQANTFAAVDLAPASALLAAVAFSAPSSAGTSNRPIVDAAFSGLLAGFALGCKISFAPLLLILLGWHLALCLKNDARRVPSVLLAYVAGAALTGGYWYLRNWLITGNPLFPAAVGPFDGPFSAAEQDRTKLISWVIHSPHPLQFIFTVARNYITWPLVLGLLSAFGYCVAVRRSIANLKSAPFEALLAVLGLAAVISFPFMPFSGTYNEPNADVVFSPRYLILPFVLGIVLFAATVEPEQPHRRLWTCVAIVSAAMTWNVGGLSAVGALAAGVLAFVLLSRPSVAVRPRYGFGAGAIASFLMLFGCGLYEPIKKRLTDEQLYATVMGEHQQIGRAWGALNALPRGSRIAQFGSNAFTYYPLFGRDWQLVPTALSQDGSPFRPVYEQYVRGSFEWWPNPPSEVELDRLVNNLLVADVNYVLVLKADDRASEPPPENRALSNSDLAQSVYDDGYSTIWRLGRRNR